MYILGLISWNFAEMAEEVPIKPHKRADLLYYESFSTLIILGIYDEPNCSSTSVNHAVLLVGYNTSPDYWIVKNRY